MRKLVILVSAIISVFVGFSFAYSITPSYSTNGNDVTIYRNDNGNGGYMDINLKNPATNDWLHFAEVKVSDESFTYTKQREGDQEFQIVLSDGSTPREYLISSEKGLVEVTNGSVSNENNEGNGSNATRTVIPAVPKTGPSVGLVGIILATLAIFGGYIYIKRKADI